MNPKEPVTAARARRYLWFVLSVLVVLIPLIVMLSQSSTIGDTVMVKKNHQMPARPRGQLPSASQSHLHDAIGGLAGSDVALLYGEVRTLDSEPLVAADVCAYPGDDWDKRTQAIRPVCGQSDASGRFEIHLNLSVDSMTVRVSAGHRGFEPILGSGGATFVRASAGMRHGPISLILQPGGREVRGVVVDALGGTIAGAEVFGGFGTAATSARATKTYTDDDGRFQLWLGHSDVSIFATADGYGTRRVNFSGTADELTITLHPEGELRGRVVWRDTGNPVPSAKVWSESVERDRVFTTTDSEGEFFLAELSAGRHTLHAEAEGGRGRIPGRVTVAPGDVAEVTLSLERGLDVSIALTHSDGKPCDGCWIWLRREDDNKILHEYEYIARSGIALARGLPSGSYHASFQGSIDGSDGMESHGPVMIDSAHTEFHWQLRPRLALNGILFSPDGRRAVGAIVTAHGPGVYLHRSSGPDGEFGFEGLPEASYTLTASDRQSSWYAGPVVVNLTPSTGADVVELHGTGGAGVQAIVRDYHGTAISGRIVRVKTAGRTQTVITDLDGFFSVFGLREGAFYQIVVDRYRITEDRRSLPRPEVTLKAERRPRTVDLLALEGDG